MQNRDGRALARENEIRVLRALHRFGWLRTRDVAALAWQRWARNPTTEPSLRRPMPTATGLRMAQRTLKRLREKRQVLRSRAPDGSLIYALAEAGARILKQNGVAAITGKDQMRTFSSAHYRHRCIANEIAVGAIVEGFRTATEREVAQGLWLGGEDSIAGKKPDVLLRGDGRVWWVEVERSRKNARDYGRLLQWLGVVGRDAFRQSGPELLRDGLRWAKVVFICTEAFCARLCRDLAAAGWKKNHIDTLLRFEMSLYTFEDISFS
ncbi:MAG: replication-relaxation family protein [Betaproteobacteria bacterium]|nr:replication-relaxation family protein [Betaproteobacteria bacterium]